ncbi:O-acetylhomoserine aminocarboxypropyltransferase/cysteine synthase family protein [Micavibrio aeruginosavorus]|uniref:O-acetylhomoserine sulfhydrylase / O-succinylhomoserine sulfhydrylase n=1 Tax=Micavibrio aeruginosavorus EPB TaxID=349215 RepID=M4VIC9_9BACT|nr:O-acetylhomoserine aminocarboxypropyltransferase/cysteine synthase family protein [Micavibrio aeruginosavorus]AGH97801.1 O-acetylhomoserine sulfhydrylase / O-succinylhomoserine sulfhydrylase [Micavibrio aeruginosavorus EPB]
MGSTTMKDQTAAQQGFETLSIHAGAAPDPATGARTLPIHQSAAFVFKDAKQAADIFQLREMGYSYSRLTNPTVAALEERIAALEGGTGATCTASGLSGHLLILFTLMNAGDEIVASKKLYGGTANQLGLSFSRSFGWKTNFVDPTNPDNFRAAITERTRAIFVETLSNPEGVIVDLEAIAKIADQAGIPLIVDNTIATPYLCRPFEYGASIVVHSTTKFLNGQGNAMGGCVVDGGKFDWMKHADKFPALTQPDKGYNGIIFAKEFPTMPVAIHNHAVGLRDLGMNQQPMNAWITMNGIETLALRMERHCTNAIKVAEFLANHAKVAKVNHSALPASPYNALAKKYLRNGWGGSVFTFAVKDGVDAGKAVQSVKLFSHLANIGDTRSLIIHPASTTHAQMSPDQQKAAGVGPEVVRLSIGIESVEDIIEDLNQALANA